MINRIWSSTTMNSGEWSCFDFIYMDSADLFGTGRERKVQNENTVKPAYNGHSREKQKVAVADKWTFL